MASSDDATSPLTREWGRAPQRPPATPSPGTVPAPEPSSDGDDTSYPRASQARPALVLALIGLFCCGLTAIIGGIMGRLELNAIDRGESDPAGYGSAQAAFIIGLAAGLLWLIVVLLWVLAGVSAVMGAF